MNDMQTPPHVTRRRPRLVAVLIGSGVLVLIAVPAAVSGFLAFVSFTGCFLDCSEPHPFGGALWTVITLALLALPVLAGLLVARTTGPRATVGLVLAGLVLAVLLSFSWLIGMV